MWFWYALLAAVFGAVVVLLNKWSLKEVNASVVTWSLFALPLPVLVILTVVDGLPQLSGWFWVGVTGSATVFAVAKVLGMSSIRQSVLSSVYPLVPLNTLFTYVLGLIFLGEQVRLIPILGLILIVAGAYLINVQAVAKHVLMPFLTLMRSRSSRLFVVSTFGVGLASVFDKTAILGVREGGLVVVLLMENLLMAVILTGYMVKRKMDWVRQIRMNWGRLGLGAGFYTLSSLMVFKGFAEAPIALVSGVKQLQLLLVLGLSWWWFKDRPRKSVWGAVLLMMAGVVLVRVF